MVNLPSQTEYVTPLEQLIRARICKHGPMPVSEYMSLALAHPEYGYYHKSDPLGRTGDFITAPEISQVFGEIIGLWCVITWQQAGHPSPIHLVELGPGRGTLMADALRAAATVPEFIAAAKIDLVETSPVLRNHQKQALLGHDTTWHSAIDTVSDGPCLYIANEFFDALPIDQYVKSETAWNKRCVGEDPSTGRLCFVVDSIPTNTEDHIPSSVVAAPPGSVFERSSAGQKIATIIGKRLAVDAIAALNIDYGHRQPNTGETLQAVRGHEFHDVLCDPGDADLTAHVDFGSLADAAQAVGATSYGAISQGDFLSQLGIEARTSRLATNQNKTQADLLLSGCRRLIDPHGMGTLFKVLALTNGKLGNPAGFEALTEKSDHREPIH
jgi:NADH dehydrogenase [ubiquinone] 1 alpha subcomplex assembly factor 7